VQAEAQADAKMRSRRASLAKARDPFFQPLDGIAQLRDRRAQRFELPTPHSRRPSSPA